MNKANVIKEVVGLHRRIGTRLFGNNGKDCLNLSYTDKDGEQKCNNGNDRISYYNNGETPVNGILGAMMDEIELLKGQVAKLEKKASRGKRK